MQHLKVSQNKQHIPRPFSNHLLYTSLQFLIWLGMQGKKPILDLKLFLRGPRQSKTPAVICQALKLMFVLFSHHKKQNKSG